MRVLSFLSHFKFRTIFILRCLLLLLPLILFSFVKLWKVEWFWSDYFTWWNLSRSSSFLVHTFFYHKFLAFGFRVGDDILKCFFGFHFMKFWHVIGWVRGVGNLNALPHFIRSINILWKNFIWSLLLFNQIKQISILNSTFYISSKTVFMAFLAIFYSFWVFKLGGLLIRLEIWQHIIQLRWQLECHWWTFLLNFLI